MINNDLESDIMIRSIHDVKATKMGGQNVMFKAEVDIDGREITRSYLDNIDIEKLLTVLFLKKNIIAILFENLYRITHSYHNRR